jgi:hypothetical protein
VAAIGTSCAGLSVAGVMLCESCCLAVAAILRGSLSGAPLRVSATGTAQQ